ncbi:cell wall hydrolase [Novosphingobium barchaimii]|uniref:cell wall hydrolase n=1 Tax=Novosphingobium barchaimii TaxID=1420591 RepID=UPI0009E9379C|nr:cell wall hydrolase [Novosphingobium barchaimii]
MSGFPAEEAFERPRDFTGRYSRRARGVGRHPIKLRRRWTLGVAVFAAVALPAFAEPNGLGGGWDRFSIADAGTQEPSVLPMPFEQSGASFPGSAFYYLDTDAAPLRIGEGIRSDADDTVSGPTLGAGPTARALDVLGRIDNSGVDRSRALQCLTAAIYYEAASEPDAGQRAVAQVVLNRVAHPAYPKSVCGVVYEGSERPTGCQFSFTCDGALARRPQAMFWDRAENVARQALSGYVYAPVGLATHYHTVQVSPYWAPSLNYLGTIGAHRFYSMRGAAGAPATFRYAYFGGEPMAAPHRRDDSSGAAAAAAALDPLAVQRAFGLTAEPAVAKEAPAAQAAPTMVPVYSSQVEDRGGDSLYRAKNLPGSQGIKAEYANSGRWIANPGN